MRYKKTGKGKYVISIAPGEKFCEQLSIVLEKEGMKNASFSALGACDECELAHYDVEKREYSSRKFTGAHEIANITGNVFLFEERPLIHAHITIGNKRFEAFSGHLVECRISAACEIILTPLDAEIGKKHSEKIGLKLLDL